MAPLLLLLPAYEAGFLSSTIAKRFVGRDRVREILVRHDNKPRTTLPAIDEKLRTLAGAPTKSQAWVVRWLARGIRWMANTRAFEYILLIQLKKIWPKGQSISSEVKLCI